MSKELPKPIPAGSPSLRPTQAAQVVELRRAIDQELEGGRRRTEVLKTLRAVALGFLPTRRTQDRQLTRQVRLGRDLYVTVTFTGTKNGVALPFGADRLLLHGLFHMAIERGQRRITFESAAQLLELMGVDKSGRSYRRLRQSLERIAALHISVATSDLPGDGDRGANLVVVDQWHLPSRESKASTSEHEQQLALPGMAKLEPHFVELSQALMDQLESSGESQLLVRLDVLRLCTGKPKLFDLVMFLFHRCGAARTESVVPHDALMDLFQTGTEDDRKTIYRLRKYLNLLREAIGYAQDGTPRLNAELVEMEPEASTGPGRKTKRWGLRIRPSSQWPISTGSRAAARGRVLDWQTDEPRRLGNS